MSSRITSLDVDIFVDFSLAIPEDIPGLSEALIGSDGLGALRPALSCVLADSIGSVPLARNWRIAYPKTAVEAAAAAVEAAGVSGRPLLFLLGGFVPSIESVGSLLDALERDPLFGFAVPRMATSDRSGIERQSADPEGDEILFLPRRAICDLPEFYIVPEMVAPCVLVRNTVLANLTLCESGFKSVAGALLHLLARARRIGFRGVVTNRVVVAWCPERSRTDKPDFTDLLELLRLIPDMGRGRFELSRLPMNAHEAFLARAHSPEAGVRRSLLLDATAMRAYFNGTSECVLGILGGLYALRHDWTVTVAARPDAADFHDLARRFPDWKITANLTACHGTVAFKLSQPWAFETMLELHHCALLNYYLVLDTIAWDVLFNSLEYLDEIWRFSAQYADGLLYISDFTGERFKMRFPLGPGVRERTLHLSFHPRDYVRPEARNGREKMPGYCLVVGNPYDHKDLAKTVDTLATCFPFQPIRAVGLVRSDNPNIEAIPSGAVSPLEMELLYAQARVIVFPSFYEGFGFPIIRGLSYGRPVVARQSDLLDELRAHYLGEGRLFAFSTHIELAEIVSDILRGEPVESLLLGGAVAPGAEPLDWRAIAANMLAFFEECLVEPGQGRWYSRENAFRQMAAYKP